MNQRRLLPPKKTLTAFAALLCAGLAAPAVASVQASYLYHLSDFTGRVPFVNGVRLSLDPAHDEVYVSDGESVRVFNQAGMEVYEFIDNQGSLGVLYDVMSKPDGELLVLSREDVSAGDAWMRVSICDYRGEFLRDIELRDLPPSFEGFSPNRAIAQDGRLYLVERLGLRLAIFDEEGRFQTGYDLLPLLGLEEKDRESTELAGFCVDDGGNIWFTVPVLFHAYRLAPDGQVVYFGQSGSAPGRLNIVGGIAVDRNGRILLTDQLRCVVMVFTPDFRFLGEFGYRGVGRENLIVPESVAVDARDRVYVTQGGRQGVKVFSLHYD